MLSLAGDEGDDGEDGELLLILKKHFVIEIL